MRGLDHPIAEAPTALDRRLAERLRSLRQGRGWSLDALAERSGVSRASLSRIETGAVSPTAQALGKLCSAYELTLSRLMQMVESEPTALVRRADQLLWEDAEAGFARRIVSPPSGGLAGEAIEAELAPGAALRYHAPTAPGLEHHLVMIEGRLRLSVGRAIYDLAPGDCLRYRGQWANAFDADPRLGARYLLFVVSP